MRLHTTFLFAALTTLSAAKTLVVSVGPNGAHEYFPNVTRADVGDVISFQFYPSNHSVIRGEYTESTACGPAGCNPCVPFGLLHPDQSDLEFHSRNVLTQKFDPAVEGSTYNITIRNTDPIWFFCTAIESCAPNGMVGVINPGANQSIVKQIEAAKKSKIQLAPGQSWPIEGATVGSEDASSKANSSSGATSTTAPDAHDHGGTHLSAGAIAGIAIGGAAVIILAAGLCFFVGRTKTLSETVKRQSEFGGGTSTVGDTMSQSHGPSATTPAMAPWSPHHHAPSQGHHTPSQGHQSWQQDPRMSGQAPFSPPPQSYEAPSGHFVGYNRQTGAPEFATEAPASVGEKFQSLPGGHPAFHGGQGTTYELPAGSPVQGGGYAHQQGVLPDVHSVAQPEKR